jgi:hypothetical protein
MCHDKVGLCSFDCSCAIKKTEQATQMLCEEKDSFLFTEQSHIVTLLRELGRRRPHLTQIQQSQWPHLIQRPAEVKSNFYPAYHTTQCSKESARAHRLQSSRMPRLHCLARKWSRMYNYKVVGTQNSSRASFENIVCPGQVTRGKNAEREKQFHFHV